VVAIGARNLEAKDDGGVSDPFCIVSVLSMGSKEIESKKGKPITRTIKPIWNDAYTFVLHARPTP
jgi:Ca2+-dependent lipid-binding protein